MKTINIENLKCACVPNEGSKRVVYMIYPSVSVFTEDWLQEQSEKCGCSIVIIYVGFNDWDNLLTPWAAPGVPKNSPAFKGEAAEFNQLLIERVIPVAEKALSISDIEERDLIGVSLGGLFTLWQWMQFDTFRSIGCLSGSFWYEGFLDWFDKQPVPQKSGKAFFLLGTDEPKASVKAFQTVGKNTEAIVARLKSAGIPVEFEWVQGDHFANPVQRAEQALKYFIQ